MQPGSGYGSPLGRTPGEAAFSSTSDLGSTNNCMARMCIIKIDYYGNFLGYYQPDSYPGGSYYSETYEYDSDTGDYDIYVGAGWSNSWAGGDYTSYYSDGDEYYTCLIYALDATLEQSVIAQVSAEIIEEQVDTFNTYWYLAPWFVYDAAWEVYFPGYSPDLFSANVNVEYSDNAGNQNSFLETLTFNPAVSDSMPIYFGYGANDGLAGIDITGTLTVEDTDPYDNPSDDDVYYELCHPGYVYSADDAIGTASYKFYNPNTYMSVGVNGNSELVESSPSQSVSFRIYRSDINYDWDTYNARTVHFSIWIRQPEHRLHYDSMER